MNRHVQDSSFLSLLGGLLFALFSNLSVGDNMTHYIKISAPDDVYGVLKAYADLMGTTPSTLIRDLIIEISPAFNGVVEAMKVAEQNKHVALSRMQGVLLNGISSASSLASEVQEEINGL